jgi:DNA-binding transcriptional regulator YhcF (GntR family)
MQTKNSLAANLIHTFIRKMNQLGYNKQQIYSMLGQIMKEEEHHG